MLISTCFIHINYKLVTYWKTHFERNLLSFKSAFFWGIMRHRVVNNYHTTLRNTPEDRRFHQHRSESLKLRLVKFIQWGPG
jgi:hypothetical protein